MCGDGSNAVCLWLRGTAKLHMCVICMPASASPLTQPSHPLNTSASLSGVESRPGWLAGWLLQNNERLCFWCCECQVIPSLTMSAHSQSQTVLVSAQPPPRLNPLASKGWQPNLACNAHNNNTLLW